MSRLPDPERARRIGLPCFALMLLVAVPSGGEASSWTALWATPAVLLAAMMIAWAAESAQFFIAQGLALAMLAWLQTLPEFAVEFVFAWRRDVPNLLANLTGALRLLTGLGWPMIYFVAAFFHRRSHGYPLRRIQLADEHCVEVVGLLVPLVYVAFIWAKGSLNIFDAAVLILIYVAYLWVLKKMPPEEAEGIEDLERIPRGIVKARPPVRTALIIGLFVGGGLLIYLSAEPFLDGLKAISLAVGITYFVFVQWVAPFVSEFPEKVSAFYWARTVDRAPMALMNMVSSNINQWTLLAAMLPIVYSISLGAPSSIAFDQRQELELLMTLAQSLIGMIFLINMELAWWEAATLFLFWGIQFAFSPFAPEIGKAPHPGLIGYIGENMHWWVTVAYFVWVGAAVVRMLMGRRKPHAFRLFAVMWRTHVRKGPDSPALQ